MTKKWQKNDKQMTPQNRNDKKMQKPNDKKHDKNTTNINNQQPSEFAGKIFITLACLFALVKGNELLGRLCQSLALLTPRVLCGKLAAKDTGYLNICNNHQHEVPSHKNWDSRAHLIWIESDQALAKNSAFSTCAGRHCAHC